MIAFPSSVLASPEIGGFGAFVIFALLAATIVFFEYAAVSPSLIEFRYAPPYNRFRVLVFGFITMFIVSTLNLNNQVGPIFDVVAGISNLASGVLNNAFSPIPSLLSVLQIESPVDKAEFTTLAEGSLFVAFVTAILFCFVIWLQRWPLSNQGFNLWPNMPSFHARAGSKTETRMIQIAILSIAMAIALPYLFPIVLQVLKDWLGFQYSYTRHSAFWIIAFWALIPAMALMRALVLLKVAYLASQLRSMNTKSQAE